MNPYRARIAAVVVPNIAPDKILAQMKSEGKCYNVGVSLVDHFGLIQTLTFTRILIMPFAIVTVCSGTSCLKATRKPACKALVPETL